MNDPDECVFCSDACERMDSYSDLDAGDLGPDGAPSYLFARVPGFRILGDNAPLTVGHLLVVPDRHARSAAMLPAAELEQTDLIVTTLLESLSSTGNGGALVFEHGTGACTDASSCCLVHTHLHVVAAPTEVDGWFGERGVTVIGRTGSLTDLVRAGTQEYLFAQRHGRPGTIWQATGLPSQIMRRLVGEDLGVALWNWHDRLLLQTPAERIAETVANRAATTTAVQRVRQSLTAASVPARHARVG